MKKTLCIILFQMAASALFAAPTAGEPCHNEYLFSTNEKSITKSPTNLSKKLTNLRKRLAIILNDIDKVDVVVKQYRRLLRQVQISHKERAAIDQWLIDKCIFVCSKYYDHDLIFDEVPALQRNKKFCKAFEEFAEQISANPRELLENEPEIADPIDAFDKAPKKKRITVLYTGCYGAGHKSPATALAGYFEKQGHKVQLIDIDDIQNKYSPRVHGYTRAQIYAEVYQKEGNAKKAHKLSAAIEKAHRTENRKFMIDLKKMIARFHTDMIFTVAHHRPNLGYLSYQMNIPMVYVHTDHVFHRSLVPILKEQMKLRKNLIRFTVLSNNSNFFKHINAQLKIKKGKLPPSAERQLVRLDFPVRESFQSVTKSEKNHIRDELHIPRNSIVCKLAMGQNALAKEITDILGRMVKQEKKLTKPLHVFTICGKNEELKKQLEKTVKKSVKPHSKIHVDVCGFKEEKEMAQIDQASDVWITKPGGSTSAELVQTKKQMLYVIATGHPWEKSNAFFLEKLKLAQGLSKSKPIIKQIKERMKVDKTLDPEKIPESRWHKQASRIVWKLGQ